MSRLNLAMKIKLINGYSIRTSTCVSVHIHTHIHKGVGCPRGVMVKAMDCGIVVREFVLQSRHYVHFRANTLAKDMNPLVFPAMG